MSDIKETIRKYALRNAVEHEGSANLNAVLSGVMSDHRNVEPKEIIKDIKKVLSEVNDLTLEEQKSQADDMGINLERKKEEDDTLPDIPNEEGQVITRAAPNPNGPFHLGNSRAYILSYLYAKRNDGRFILRYDDTNPSSPEKSPKKRFYSWIEEDLKWLGCEPDLIIKSSDRLEMYYGMAFDLIEEGKAYVCICESKKWKRLRDKKKGCPCRKIDPGENINRWHKMQDGGYEEGEAVVRIKTDIKHKNPARRDWPALRILKNHSHPLVNDDYIIWPLYNFASAIDDHELNVTHIFRAKEHSTNTENQKDLYEHFGWEYPTTIHHGFLSLKGSVLSTSKIRGGIDSGKYSGWDDPRLGTVRALRRRGFQPEAIHSLIRKYGIKGSNAEVSMEEFTSMNRKIIDPKSNRYFFVGDPVEINVVDPEKKGEVELPVHPDKDKVRKLDVGQSFLIEKKDFEPNRGSTIRLKGLYNIEVPENGYSCKYAGDDITREMPKVHWLPDSDKETTECKVVMPSSECLDGRVERNVLGERDGSMIQFERFGFLRVDNGDERRFYFTHK